MSRRKFGAGAAKRRPLGGPGMPEWGMLPIPKKLLQRGVRDMVRISDARMSGTVYGTCVLHVSPESYVGGPLALVNDGDSICWMSRIASWSCSSRMRNWMKRRARGLLLRRCMGAGIWPCMPSVSRRLTMVAISIFWRAVRRSATRRFINLTGCGKTRWAADKRR